jgi:MFS family permease
MPSIQPRPTDGWLAIAIDDGNELASSLYTMMIAGEDGPVTSVVSAPRPPRPRHSRRTHRHHFRSFWVVGYVFAVTIAFASAPAPLYALYAQRDGYGSLAITVIFGAYAVGVVVALFLAGHISDRFGRRRILAPAILMNVLAGLMFLVWNDLAGLLLARFVSGLGIGMLTATATAHMAELFRRSGRSGSRLPAVVATVANIGGIGIGPLVAGLLADFSPEPLIAPYLVFLFLMVTGSLVIVAVPETVDREDGAWRYRPQRVVVPRAARASYSTAVLTAFVGFSFFGFFTSLAPSLIRGELGLESLTLAGAVSFLVFGAAALFQIVTSRWRTTHQFAIALPSLAVGVTLVVSAVVVSSFALLVVGGLVTGIGSGVLFKAAVGIVLHIAPPDTMGEALAGLYLGGYLGLCVPVVFLGGLLQVLPTTPSVITFGAAMLVLVATITVFVTRQVARRAPGFTVSA